MQLLRRQTPLLIIRINIHPKQVNRHENAKKKEEKNCAAHPFDSVHDFVMPIVWSAFISSLTPMAFITTKARNKRKIYNLNIVIRPMRSSKYRTEIDGSSCYSFVGNYFGSHFIMGGEKFDTPQPESYLFGENADLNFLGSRPTAVSSIRCVLCVVIEE